MKRRGLTVLLGAVLVALLMAGIGTADVPYVVLAAGPTVNTLSAVDGKDVIQVSGAPTSTSKGELRLVTVSVQSSTDLLSAIRGWFSDEEAVVPRELIYPPDQSQDQVDKQNQEEFKNSQTSAETAALRELGYPVQVTVAEINKEGAAEGKLKVGDVINTLDGATITSTDRLVELIKAKPTGSTLKLGITRDKVTSVVELTTRPASASDDSPRIGVTAENKQPHPFELSIKLDDIGGPSAGLMFALGIIDKLKTEDLTGGAIIAGTGTIDNEGKVGPIGGIPQKLHGAKTAGAKIFLTPADNCAEAKANALDGLALVKVATLDDALAALAALRAGGKLPSC